MAPTAAARAALALALLALAASQSINHDLELTTPAAYNKREYSLPWHMVDLARKNNNSTLERRGLQMKMKALKASCKESTSVSVEELSNIKQEGPSSQAGKCFLGCMMEGMDILEGGAFAAARAERLVSAVYAEGAKRRSARRAVAACAQQVTSTDKCETGGLIFECFQRHRVGLFGAGSA